MSAPAGLPFPNPIGILIDKGKDVLGGIADKGKDVVCGQDFANDRRRDGASDAASYVRGQSYRIVAGGALAFGASRFAGRAESKEMARRKAAHEAVAGFKELSTGGKLRGGLRDVAIGAALVGGVGLLASLGINRNATEKYG